MRLLADDALKGHVNACEDYSRAETATLIRRMLAGVTLAA